MFLWCWQLGIKLHERSSMWRALNANLEGHCYAEEKIHINTLDVGNVQYGHLYSLGASVIWSLLTGHCALRLVRPRWMAKGNRCIHCFLRTLFFSPSSMYIRLLWLTVFTAQFLSCDQQTRRSNPRRNLHWGALVNETASVCYRIKIANAFLAFILLGLKGYLILALVTN